MRLITNNVVVILKKLYRLSAYRKVILMFSIASVVLMVNCGWKSTKPLSSTSLPDSTVVFVPGGEYASMRIPALVITKKGTLLAFCEARIGTASDWADMDM